MLQKQRADIKRPNLPFAKSAHQKVQVDNLAKSEAAKKGKIIIEPYEYDEENMVGQGATSKVYLGRKCKDHRFLVAVKVVDKKKICKDKQNFELLKQEIQIHKDIDHPNIVKCYQIIEKNNHYYFILEYCPHGNLDGFIKKFQYLSESVTTNILEQILSGYRYLMKHKIIHRDLKPPNILKSGYIWKICDFGFSVRGKKNLIGELNVGTPSYMAPQSLQRNYYSCKTDFFSFGVICYEMLFANPPWQNKNQKILLQMMLQQKINPQNLSTLANKNLSQFILKCCQPVQRKRIAPEQFQAFDFCKSQPLTKQEPIKSNKQGSFHRLSSQSFHVKGSNKATNDVSKQSNLSTIKGSKKQSLQQIMKANQVIIDKQLHCLKIIYQILKNIKQLSFADHDDQQIFITIFNKYSLRVIRRVKQAKFNHFCLKKWQQYIQTTPYSSQLQQLKELSSKIQHILKGQTRRKSIAVIRVINRKYDELTYDKMLSSRCTDNIKQYLLDLVNRNVGSEGRTQSNIKKWVIHFLMNYYRCVGAYFDNFYTSRIEQTQQEIKQLKIEDNYADIIYSEESFGKILQEIRGKP